MYHKNNHCYVDLKKLNKLDYAHKVLNHNTEGSSPENYSELILCKASALSRMFRIKPITIGKIVRTFNEHFDKEYEKYLETNPYLAKDLIKRKIKRIHLHNEDGSREIAYTQMGISKEISPITFYTDTVENSDYTMYIGNTHFKFLHRGVPSNGYHLTNTSKDGELKEPLWISDFLHPKDSIQSRLEHCGVAIVCGSDILIRELHGKMPLKEKIPPKYHDVWDRAYLGEI